MHMCAIPQMTARFHLYVLPCSRLSTGLLEPAPLLALALEQWQPLVPIEWRDGPLLVHARRRRPAMHVLGQLMVAAPNDAEGADVRAGSKDAKDVGGEVPARMEADQHGCRW